VRKQVSGLALRSITPAYCRDVLSVSEAVKASVLAGVALLRKYDFDANGAIASLRLQV
jgi:hypothetical protein